MVMEANFEYIDPLTLKTAIFILSDLESTELTWPY